MGRKNRRKVEYRKRLPTVKQLYAHRKNTPSAHPYIKKDLMEDYPHRMEYWYARIPLDVTTCVEGGDRPVLIVSNNKANQYSQTVTAVPLTSKIKRMDIPTHVLLNSAEELTRNSVVLAEQITTLPKAVLVKKLGDCTSAEIITAIEKAMEIQLGLRKEDDLMNYQMSPSMDTCNTMKEYLDALPSWDGVPRLDRMLTEYLGAADNKYVHAVSRKMLVAAVARTYAPGTPFAYLPFLFGRPGIGKSMLLLKLAGQFCEKSYWPELTGDVLSGLYAENTTIVECSGVPYGLMDSSSTHKKHFQYVNDAISYAAKTEDQVEDEYGNVKRKNRSFITVITNNEGFSLLDCYHYCWPVRVGDTEPKYNVLDLYSATLEQLWAEAKSLYEQGEPLELSMSEFAVGTR